MQYNSVSQIRSLGFSKVNRLVRAARHLDDLLPAFAEWQAGEIYVCKKTRSYRYRFGDRSKSPAVWSRLAEQLFDSPAAFALAAMVLAPESAASSDEQEITPAADRSGRVNVIALAA